MIRVSIIKEGWDFLVRSFGHGVRFVFARRAWSSTPLVLSLNLAMCGLTWYLAAMGLDAGAVARLAEQQGAGEQEAASQVPSSSCSGLQVMKVCPAICWISRTSWSSRIQRQFGGAASVGQ
jgi:hypothetical protein